MTDLTELTGKLHVLDGKRDDSIEALLQYEENLNRFQDEAYNRFDSTTADHYVELAERGRFKQLYRLLGGGQE